MSRLAVTIAASLLIVSALSGCKYLQLSEIGQSYGRMNYERGNSYATDAGVRTIVNVRVSDVKEHEFLGRLTPNRVICVEPSPDVAKAISDSIAASLQAAVNQQSGTSAQGTATLAHASAQSLAQLGERLATIQLLRDELADLCRSYMNGAVSTTTYTLRLARLDRKMVTMLLAEMGAGAFGRGLAAIGGTANASNLPAATPESIDKAKAEYDAANTKHADKKKELDTAKSDLADLQKKPGSDEEIAKAKERVAKTESEERDARLEATNKAFILATLATLHATAGASAVALQAPGSLSLTGRGTAQGPDFVALQQGFLTEDESGVLLDACISTLDVNLRESILPRDEWEKKINSSISEIAAARAELQQAKRQPIQSQSPQLLMALEEKVDAKELALAKLFDSIQEIYQIRALSAFGQYCRRDGIRQAILANRQNMAERARRSVSELELARLRTCAPVLSGEAKNASAELKEYCARVMREAPAPSPDYRRDGETGGKDEAERICRLVFAGRIVNADKELEAFCVRRLVDAKS
ncbi:MAG: hypothetical protein KIT81_12870 [Alphaproteobacteria bacterium]|nr:hypothetical protein [Alphaproteobacteria bacterium]